MSEKLKNVSGMIFDIYEEDLHTLPVIKTIYSELVITPTKRFPPVTKADRKMLIYVALVYDKNSPLRRDVLVNRKTVALEQAGVDNGETIDIWCNMRSDRLVMMIHYYLRYQDDYSWAALCTIGEFFWKLQIDMSTSLGEKGEDNLKDLQIQSKLRDEFSRTIDEIRKYQDIVFGDNKDKMSEIINFYPEDFVELLEEKEKELKNKS